MNSMFKATVKDPQQTTYDGEDNDEKILYVVRESFWTFIPNIITILIMIFIPIIIFPFLGSINVTLGLGIKPSFLYFLNIYWYVIAFGFAFQVFIIWYFNIFIITNKKIVDFDVIGLTYKNVSEASLRNIEDVTSRVSGTFGTIFNIGEVFVQTAAEQTEFEFTQVDNPGQIRDVIADLMSKVKDVGGNN